MAEQHLLSDFVNQGWKSANASTPPHAAGAKSLGTSRSLSTCRHTYGIVFGDYLANIVISLTKCRRWWCGGGYFCCQTQGCREREGAVRTFMAAEAAQMRRAVATWEPSSGRWGSDVDASPSFAMQGSSSQAPPTTLR